MSKSSIYLLFNLFLLFAPQNYGECWYITPHLHFLHFLPVSLIRLLSVTLLSQEVIIFADQ